MKVVNVSRYLLVVTSATLLLLAVVSSVVAIITPAWQTVFIAEFQSEHQHGLWIDCTVTKLYTKGLTHHSHCTYKFENQFEHGTDAVHPEEQQHKFHEWHKVVLVLFATAIISATTALCFSFCALCIRICAIVTNVMSLVAALSSGFAMTVFFINSHRNDIRFVQGITTTYEQSKGYSYYLGIASMLAYIAAFFVSVLATVMVFLHERQQFTRAHKTFPKNRNHQLERPAHTGPASISV